MQTGETISWNGGLQLYPHLTEVGDYRLACHLIELAVQAEPGSRESHAARAEIYQDRRKSEPTLMSKGIYAAAARESGAALE